MTIRQSEILFRQLTSDDSQKLTSFFERNNIRAVTDHFDPFPLDDQSAHSITHSPGLDRFYAATLDDQIVGFSMLRGWNEGYEIPSFGIVIDHDMQGRRYGSTMTDFTIDQARSFKCPHIRLSVYASNHRAYNLYRSRGFQEHSRKQVTRSYGNDYRVVMLLDLQSK